MNVFRMLFGCWHRHCSFPLTVRGQLRRRAAASVTGTYVVCLDCGQEFPYDWNRMKRVKAVTKPRTDSSEPETVMFSSKAA
jgi:RNase P subunit RPR2